MAIVYCIKDPQTGLIRYIGFTTQSLKNRKLSHMGNRQSTKLSKWIYECKTLGIKPIFETVHQCKIDEDENDARYWECFYLNKFKDEGHPLLNHAFHVIENPRDILKDVQKGKYNNTWIAERLYPDLSKKVATAKFRNKLVGLDGRSFTATEIRGIKNILK